MRAPTFVHGEYFDQVVVTAAGPVGLTAEVHIVGELLVLEDLLFYRLAQSDRLLIGTRETFRIFRYVRNLAAEAGFSELTVIDHRTGAHRKRTILGRTRKLR